MKITDMRRMPCVVCKEDTLHHIFKCTVCGTPQEAPSDARRRSVRRHRIRLGLGYPSAVRAHKELRKAKQALAIERIRPSYRTPAELKADIDAQNQAHHRGRERDRI